jgi:ketosteroid isomerase-like protein
VRLAAQGTQGTLGTPNPEPLSDLRARYGTVPITSLTTLGWKMPCFPLSMRRQGDVGSKAVAYGRQFFGYASIKPFGKEANTMNRHASVALKVCALLFTGTLLIASNAKAQEADVKAAIDAYHAAISSRDITKMEPLWVHDASVMLINPRSMSVSVGWDAVRKAWEASNDASSELKVTQRDGPYIQIKGDVAIATGIASVVGKTKSGNSYDAPTFETDAFERRDGRWLLVSHTGLRVPQ